MVKFEFPLINKIHLDDDNRTNSQGDNRQNTNFDNSIGNNNSNFFNGSDGAAVNLGYNLGKQ